MVIYKENIGNRITELLNFPIHNRCFELSMIFEQCNLRELTEIFPTIVKSIFGVGSDGLGWGMRTTTKENAPQCFASLCDFFHPLGPMFRLCYRLLNDAIKFDFGLDLLPHKMSAMMQSGASASFYGDLVSIDPFCRQVLSLSLNAFDYYLLHFIMHTTVSLHRKYPVALQVHNERLKTVYFFLTAEYLNAFMPSNPEAVVLPSNICSSVKAPQPIPVQPLQPKRSPKYLKIPNSNLYDANNTTATSFSPTGRSLSPAVRNAESPRTHCWRTESVLHFFLDTWMRLDIDETRDLPSSEFVRCVRILVKQTHCFGNSFHMDSTPMATLRKAAQQMMRQRIYPFLKSLISRWPLDSSLSVVLELWYSYLQPWRYTFELANNSIPGMEIPIQSRFDSFIIENLPIYTQIFVNILPRFERLDFTSMRNVNMLHRLAKVFNQTILPKKLFHAEQSYTGNSFEFDTPQKRSSIFRHNTTSSTPNNSACNEWDGSAYYEEEYKPLFCTNVQNEIQQFIKIVYIGRIYVMEEIKKLQMEVDKIHKSYGLLKKLLLLVIKEELPLESQLKELLKIPFLLDNALRSLSSTFSVELPNLSMDQIEQQFNAQLSFSFYDNSDYIDFSRFSPRQFINNAENFTNTVDPALLPIRGYECTILVKMLHKISCRVNEKYGIVLQNCWNRSDIYGKITRQILYPPMTAKWFDKPRGVTELIEDRLPPRLCLRTFGSYRTLALFIFSLIIGHIVWHAPIYGFFYLLITIILYIFVLAFMSS